MSHHGLNIYWMADRTSCFLEQGGSRDSLRDAWAQCLAGLLEPNLLPDVCPTSLHIAWPYAYHRMGKAYAILDPGWVGGLGEPVCVNWGGCEWLWYCLSFKVICTSLFCACGIPPPPQVRPSHTSIMYRYFLSV